MENSNETWQVDAGGQIYETNFAELTLWIAEDALLPQDKIRRGNLRWIEAGKVPQLQGFFRAKELGIAPPSISDFRQSPTVGNSKINVSTETNPKKCVLHSSIQATFECVICANYFCADCLPNSSNGDNNCPMCGANCKKLTSTQDQNFGMQSTSFGANQDNAPNPITLTAPNLPNNQIQTKTNSKKVGIFSIVLLALVFSFPVAYLWAYQLSAPDEEAEKKLPQIMAMEETYKTEKEAEEKKWTEEQAAAKAKRETEKSLAQAKQSSFSSTPSGGCFKAVTNEPVKCSETLSKFSQTMAESAKSMEEHQKQIDEAMNNLSNPVLGASFPPSAAKEKLERESKKVIEEYRIQTTSRKFWLTFLISFFSISGIIFVKRKLANK